MRETKFAGIGWVKANVGVKSVSPLGEAVAGILDSAFAGIYHLDKRSLARANWGSPSAIWITLKVAYLATFDRNELTRLVVLCHDSAIRMEIAAVAHGYLKLTFTQRVREGRGFERHPTIREAVACARRWR